MLALMYYLAHHDFFGVEEVLFKIIFTSDLSPYAILIGL